MRLITVALTIFLLTSCAQLTGNMGTLEKDVKTLKEQVAFLDSRLQAVSDKLSKLEGQASTVNSNTFEALRESQTEINTKFIKLVQEFKQLNRKIDEEKYNTGLSFKESATDRDILKAQLTTLESMIKELQSTLSNPDINSRSKLTSQNQQGEPPAQTDQPLNNKSQKKNEQQVTVPSVEPAASNSTAVNNKKISIKALYDSAVKDCDAGFYKASRDKLYKILKDAPTGPYAEGSNFLIADTYYKEGSYEDAIIQYEEVLKKYPKSKVLPEALLKQGLSFIQLGGEQNIGTSKLIFKQLMNKYPKSKEAALAKEKLNSLSAKVKEKKVNEDE